MGSVLRGGVLMELMAPQCGETTHVFSLSLSLIPDCLGSRICRLPPDGEGGRDSLFCPLEAVRLYSIAAEAHTAAIAIPLRIKS